MPLRLKLTLMFLLIALVPTMLVGIVTFTQYEKSLMNSRLAALRDIAALKAEKIEKIFRTLKDDIEISQSFWNIKKNLPTLIRFSNDTANPQFVEARKILDGQLQPMQAVLGLDAIMLLNAEGKLVYSTDSEYENKNFLNPLPDPGQKAFAEGKERVYFTDIFFHKEQDETLNMFISAPSFDPKGVFTGVIVFDAKMPPIYKLIQDRTGLGDTGEVLIGKETGGYALYLSPLRFDPEAALKRKIKIGGNVGIPMQDAAQGKEGVGRSIDYRGKDVIAAWRHIPSLGWGMVAKIDSREAFMELAKLKALVMIILAVIFVIITVAAFSLAHSISRPISIITKCAEIVGAGNLECKADVNAKDEIGRLSQAFNKMVEDLKRSTTSIGSLNAEIIRRKATEQRLADSAQEWETSFNAISDIVSIQDVNHRLVKVNRAYADTFKMKPEELIGKICYPVVHGTDEPCINCPHNRTLETKEPQILEYFEPRLGAYLEISTSPIFNDKRDVIATVHIVKNITERVKMVKAIEDANEKLKELDARKSDFVSRVSHEFKNPLAIIRESTAAVTDGLAGEINAQQKKLLEASRRNTERLIRLVTDLLDLAKIEAGKMEIRREEIDLAGFLNEMVSAHETDVSKKALALAKEIPQNIGMIWADRDKLSEVVINLLSNAIKYTPAGGKVTIKAEGAENEIRFEISDTGPGIAKEDFEKIFDKFERISAEKEEGTGLGLAITKDIVALHKGKVWVESEPGKGSTFIVTLPRNPGKDDRR